jgi:hypothetical protein
MFCPVHSEIPVNTAVDATLTSPHLTVSTTRMGAKLINYDRWGELEVEVNSLDKNGDVRMVAVRLRVCLHHLKVAD